MEQQGSGGGGGSAEGSISVGQEDQLREARMEERQRREDDGLEAPETSNPHIQTPGAGPRGAASAAPETEPSAAAGDEEIWEGRADDPDHPGQTPQGGLGGSGPVQP